MANDPQEGDQNQENAQEATAEVVSELVQAELLDVEPNSNDYLQAALESNESEAGAETVATVEIEASM